MPIKRKKPEKAEKLTPGQKAARTKKLAKRNAEMLAAKKKGGGKMAAGEAQRKAWITRRANGEGRTTA